MNSITKRWVRGSLLVTILMCLVAEAVFLYYSITNYYDGARRAMTTRTSTIITQLNASAAQTGESQGVLLRRMVEQFTEKDKFELMLVNAAGKPLVTSTGFAPDDSVDILHFGNSASSTMLHLLSYPLYSSTVTSSPSNEE